MVNVRGLVGKPSDHTVKVLSGPATACTVVGALCGHCPGGQSLFHVVVGAVTLPVAPPTRFTLIVSGEHRTNWVVTVIDVDGMVKLRTLVELLKGPVHPVTVDPATATAVSVIGAPSGNVPPSHKWLHGVVVVTVPSAAPNRTEEI